MFCPILEMLLESHLMSKKGISYKRFSSTIQGGGRSYARQDEACLQYCKEHDIELIDEFFDDGMSGYHGENIKNGELGQLITKISKGEIEKGTYLIIEALDRLSRADILTQMSLFMDLLNSGINIITLLDKRVYNHVEDSEYDSQKIAFDLQYSFMLMLQGHEESKKKSKRLKDSVISRFKRAQQDQFPITGRIPAWCNIGEVNGIPRVVENEKVDVVRTIFDLSINKNMGSTAIVNYLNTNNVATMTESKWNKRRVEKVLDLPRNKNCAVTDEIYLLHSKKKSGSIIAMELNKKGIPPFEQNRWAKSSLEKILVDRRVIGEFQPYTTDEQGKKVKFGQPIINYYPEVISPEVFYSNIALRDQRRLQAGRKPSKPAQINVFKGVARCVCGNKLYYQNKNGRGETEYVYLSCKCKEPSIPYNLAKGILTMTGFLSMENLMPVLKRTKEFRKSDAEKKEIEGRLSQVEQNMTVAENYIQTCTTKAVLQQYETLANEKEALLQKLEKFKTYLPEEGVLTGTELEILYELSKRIPTDAELFEIITYCFKSVVFKSIKLGKDADIYHRILLHSTEKTGEEVYLLANFSKKYHERLYVTWKRQGEISLESWYADNALPFIQKLIDSPQKKLPKRISGHGKILPIGNIPIETREGVELPDDHYNDTPEELLRNW